MVIMTTQEEMAAIGRIVVEAAAARKRVLGTTALLRAAIGLQKDVLENLCSICNTDGVYPNWQATIASAATGAQLLRLCEDLRGHRSDWLASAGLLRTLGIEAETGEDAALATMSLAVGA